MTGRNGTVTHWAVSRHSIASLAWDTARAEPEGMVSPHEWMQLLQLVLRLQLRLLRQVLTG
ncbi:hypothetical protein GCM10017788_66980 [Amycolatopsis acidiphila]|nr:hypothetical protein GCM10017788_66980 [Amycolatopsis acidiphila]